MRYAAIRDLDVSNGENIGVSLFVQGCPFHCYNCFNPETWNFNKGKKWTEVTRNSFIDLLDREYIKRVSILGGEPLAEENLEGIFDLVTQIRKQDSLNPNKMGVLEGKKEHEIHVSSQHKNIWLYSGYTWESIWRYYIIGADIREDSWGPSWSYWSDLQIKRQNIIKNCDVFIDGRYIDSQRDITLKWRGSSNQRVIDVKKSLANNKIVLYCE